MKKLTILIVLCGALLYSCKKEIPAPSIQSNTQPTQQSCFPNQDLVGTWICDSVIGEERKNGMLLGDTTFVPPSKEADYEFTFLCVTYIDPAVTAPSLTGRTPNGPMDSYGVLSFQGNWMYIDDDYPVDTANAEKLCIDHLSSNKLILRMTRTGTGYQTADTYTTNQFIYMRRQ